MLALVLAVIGFLAFDVMRKVDALATAQSDNIQWTLSAIQVELIELENAVVLAGTGALPLAEVRRRFDIFYNRADIVTNGGIYADLVERAALGDEMARVWTVLDRAVPLIDGPDADLRQRLSGIEDEVRALRAPLRRLALEGVQVLAREADKQRAEAVGLLMRLAFATSALVVLLLAALSVVSRLNLDMGRRTSALEMTTSRLRAIVNTAIDAVIVADAEGRILDFNPAAEAIFGFGRDEVIGQPMDDKIVPEHIRPALQAGMARWRETGELQFFARGRVEIEARRKTGEVFPVEISMTTADSETGKIFVTFLRDISTRRTAEAELTRARDEALAGEKAKATLLAVMSHEMRTPLNGMLGAMELMKDTALDAAQRDFLGIMESSGQLLLHHVNDVLDISRLDSGRAAPDRAPFDLAALLHEMVTIQRPMAAVRGNALTLDIAQGLGPVTGDAPKLRQILINLVGNAIKFTRGGRVTVTAARSGGGETVEIAVRDTGVGISGDDLDRIFEEFFTADATYGREVGGTGLGLAITARLVRVLGGEIDVESTPGEGSLFRVRLPMPAAEANDPARLPAEAPVRADLPPLDVLLVEDNRTNRRVARAMLEGLGHRVTEAVDGAEGVEMAFKTAFDVVLMDISMPRLDGIEAARRIRLGGRSRHARIVALTAHAMPSELDRFRAAGMDDVATKPVSRRRLTEALSGVTPAAAPLPDARRIP